MMRGFGSQPPTMLAGRRRVLKRQAEESENRKWIAEWAAFNRAFTFYPTTRTGSGKTLKLRRIFH